MEEGDRFPTIPTFRQENKKRLLRFLECATSLQDSIRWTILVILLIMASNFWGGDKALNIRRITNLEKVSAIFFFLSLISTMDNINVKVLMLKS